MEERTRERDEGRGNVRNGGERQEDGREKTQMRNVRGGKGEEAERERRKKQRR